MGQGMELTFLQSVFEQNLWIVLTLFFFTWIFTWAKKNLDSAALGVIFAIIVVYLTFYSFPELVWIIAIFFFITSYGKDMLKKINPFEGKGLLR